MITVKNEKRSQATITKNKNRLKLYNNTENYKGYQNDGIVFLNDGDSFEIELFNPFQKEILAEIKLNNETISKGGIILRPGERIFLERYLESNNKFKFETYETDLNNPEVQEAIKNNGSVIVKFYSKKIMDNFNNTNKWEWRPRHVESIAPWFYSTIISKPDSSSNKNENAINLTGQLSNNQQNFNTTQSFSDNELKSSFSHEVKSETGRIGKGEKSDQNFKEEGMEFSPFSFQTFTYQILPKSRQPLTSKEIRNYCPECATRIKKSSWKFCPTCGEKLD